MYENVILKSMNKILVIIKHYLKRKINKNEISIRLVFLKIFREVKKILYRHICTIFSSYQLKNLLFIGGKREWYIFPRIFFLKLSKISEYAFN